MDQGDLNRFDQLFNIAFNTDGSLKSNCSNELKRRLIESCRKIDPCNSYGSTDSRHVPLNANLVTSLHRRYFS